MQPVRLSQDDSKRSALLRGFGVLEAVVSLMVCISLMSLGAKYIGQQADQILNQITATQLSQVASAAHYYAHDHFEELQGETSDGALVEWGSQEIKQRLCDNGYLPTTLPDHNPYQQRYRIVIQQPQPQLSQLLLLTQGGQIIKEAGLRQIAQKAGPSSGYISHLKPKQATGSQEGWLLEGDLATPPGHLAALNYVNANDVLSTSSLLFRKKIAGHDEYNRMEIALQMAADIELENGTKIWFNQGSNRSTVIEDGKIDLTSGKAFSTLQPGKLTVNTTNGVSDDFGIKTNSHVVAAGNVAADRNISAGEYVTADKNISAGRDITAFQDIKAGRNLYAKKLEMKDEINKWSTEIIPSEIRLENQESGNKSYVGNDKIKFSTTVQKDRSISGVWVHGYGTNEEISISADSLHIPYYLTNAPSSGWSGWSEVIYTLCGKEDTKNRIGKLFAIASTNFEEPYLILCGHSGNIYIDKGFYKY